MHKIMNSYATHFDIPPSNLGLTELQTIKDEAHEWWFAILEDQPL